MAAPDLVTMAIPGFFAAMGLEKYVLDRRSAAGDERAIGYERNDTIASLAMGVGSLAVPLAIDRLLKPFTPGRGRLGRALVLGTVGAAAVTTIADLLARRDPDGERDDALARWSRHVRPSTGVAAIAGAIVAGATSWAAQTSARVMWNRGGSRRDLGTGLAAQAGALFVWDAIYYWNHRIQHETRWLWAIHVVHHSSEHYNLSTALRQAVADSFGMFVPYGLMAFCGFRPSVIQNARALDLIYQFWIHTEAIDRLGPAETVLNTPSHHRVHHGVQPQYLDRNHGGILIVWDRLFGTFQREDERVRYGLTTNIESFNPMVIATHEYRDMIGDVAASTSWRERLGNVFGAPGWGRRRTDVATAIVA